MLAAFPANPAQAVLASSSLLNLPFETTAHSPSGLPSSPGTNQKHAQVHLLGWAGKISNLTGGHLLGTHCVRAREQASFHQSRAGFPQRSSCSLSAKARPHSTGTICPKNTLILIPNGLKLLSHSLKLTIFVKLKAGRVRPV